MRFLVVLSGLGNFGSIVFPVAFSEGRYFFWVLGSVPGLFGPVPSPLSGQWSLHLIVFFAVGHGGGEGRLRSQLWDGGGAGGGVRGLLNWYCQYSQQ